MGSSTVEAIAAAAAVGIGLTCCVGIGLERNTVEVEVGGTIIGILKLLELIAGCHVSLGNGFHKRVEAKWSS